MLEYLFNKIPGLQPAALLKKRLWHRCFPVNFPIFLRRHFLQNTSGQLLRYGLNERKGKSDNLRTIGSLYFPIKRRSQRNCWFKNRRKQRRFSNRALEFREFFSCQLISNLRHSFLKTKKYLDNCKKDILKIIFYCVVMN